MEEEERRSIIRVEGDERRSISWMEEEERRSIISVEGDERRSINGIAFRQWS